MTKAKRNRNVMLFIGAFSILVGLAFISMLFGSKNLSPVELIEALIVPERSPYGKGIYSYRMPRLLLSLMVGAALAIAGTIFQGVLRNPLASTDVLGIGKGAGLAACLVMTLGSAQGTSLTSATFLGGLSVAGIIYWLTRKNGFQNTNVIIMGVAMSALCDAGIQYLNYKDKASVQNVFVWLTGSVWGRYWDEVELLLPVVLVLVPLSILMAHKIDILALGENMASSLGEHVGRIRLGLILIAVLLTTSSVAVSGTIGFIGLIAPHIAKSLVGHKHRVVIPFSGMVGAILLVAADTAGRSMFGKVEMPAGVVIAMVGAPYFLYLLLKKK